MVSNVTEKTLRLEKLTIAILILLLSGLFTDWLLTGHKVVQIELQMAEQRGATSQMLQTMQSLAERGSMTAQRTEVVVTNLEQRMGKFEDFMNKGRRFTADDGDRVEKKLDGLIDRVQRLEMQGQGNRK